VPTTLVDSLILMSSTQPDSAGIPGLGGLLKLTFASGLPGFPEVRAFEIVSLGKDLLPFARLISTTHPGVAFTVVAPGLLFPDYSVEIDEEHQVALGISQPDESVTMVIVTVARPPIRPSVNLLGPIIANRHTGAAAQVVQHRSNYAVAESLPA